MPYSPQLNPIEELKNYDFLRINKPEDPKNLSYCKYTLKLVLKKNKVKLPLSP